MPDRASRCRYLLGLRAGVDDRSKQASDALDAALAFYRGPGLIKDGATGRHLDAMASASTQLLDVQRLGVASATNAMAAVDPGAPCLPR